MFNVYHNLLKEKKYTQIFSKRNPKRVDIIPIVRPLRYRTKSHSQKIILAQFPRSKISFQGGLGEFKIYNQFILPVAFLIQCSCFLSLCRVTTCRDGTDEDLNRLPPRVFYLFAGLFLKKTLTLGSNYCLCTHPHSHPV